ncbi:DNA-binding protein Ikaros-like isoform X2 [Saccostrea echinata]|uniref:DNA-binding protein Ikaros-like isoform X2 n=1 Tax=Saccostrea echinata TaxID=191078 RepID=UPI002A828048|nr:DNA-binding protein Ikaros-like isoform X2 [Saccostrea echinata]
MLISTDSSAMDEDGADKQNGIRLPATTGPRPYKCDVCQRSFREVATLRKHEQLHRADRPYVCQTCGKSFLWSSNLKVHERVHTGERPYKCKICHRCFTQSNDLRRHERNVHMRGKLTNYRSPIAPSSRNTSHMNLATYQAFAMQQRALLHHALTYESLMQSAVVTQARLMQAGGSTVSLPSMSAPSDTNVSTSSDSHLRRPMGSPDSIKLEQVTPPSSPNSNRERSLSNPGLVNSAVGGDQLYVAPRSSSTSAISAGLLHSPPVLSTSTYSGYVAGSNSVNGSPPALAQVTATMSPTLSGYKLSFESASTSSLPHSALRRLPPISSIYSNHLNTSVTDNKVIDLSMKSTSSGESEDGDWKSRIIAEHFKREETSLIASKSPPVSETESDEKRDVTTTSITPTGDSGIHHCPHCNIFFHDFTMYHLHKSLHSPLDNDPFRCPSCQKHCQDRIEFMFHIVWHVKYPHTIPNYEPFKEEYQT